MLQTVLNYISLVIGVISVIIILYGIGVGLIEFIRAEIQNLQPRRAHSFNFQGIRHDIGFHLILGLEFLIAADIVRTIVSPNLEELAILAGLVAIRTVISYFLGKEISQHIENARK